MTDADRMMTFDDVADRLQIGRSKLKEWRKLPDFPRPALDFKRSDGRAAVQRWWPAQIDSWVAAQSAKVPA